MSTNTDISRRIEEALDSVADIRRAEPKPFFFTRVMARLAREEKSVWEIICRVVTRPAVALSSITLVLLLNFLVLFSESSDAEPEIAEMAMVDEYRMSNSLAGYDIENIQP